MVNEGLKLMFLGMAGVFLFLMLLVVIISVVAFFFKKFYKTETVTAGAGGIPRGHIAAISAAVAAYLNIRSCG